MSIVTGFLIPSAGDEAAPDPLAYTLIEVGVLALWLLALVGLWRFLSWARVVYVGVASIGLLAILLLGSEERGGPEALLNAACWLVTGAIIALGYWSPVSAAFTRGGSAGSVDAEHA